MLKKAVVEIELAIILFLIIVIFVSIFQIFLNKKDELNKSYEVNYLDETAKDVCYILTNSPGIPDNWNNDIDNLSLLGLYNWSNEQLSDSKINYLERANVNNTLFVYILDKLNYSFNFYIEITDLSNTKYYLLFGKNFNNNQYYSDYTCYSTFNNTPVKVEVKVWS